MLTRMKALNECLRTEFGNNQSKMASALGVFSQTVNEVIRSGKRVPASWCPKLELATEGRFTGAQFRPDLYQVSKPRKVKPKKKRSRPVVLAEASQ